MKSKLSNVTKAFLLCSFFYVLNTTAQTIPAPEKMSYQAVVRNTSNNLVTNQSVGMKISILKGSTTGIPVYVETQIIISNANGLVAIQVGDGTLVSGDIATIDWVNGPYFIKTEIDPTGGTNYTITGTTQLLSVPYALYAKTSGGSMPTGGNAGQVLAKVNATDYNTQWVTPTAGGSGATLALLATKTSDPQILPNANSTTDASALVTYQTVSVSVPDIGTFNNNGVFTVLQAGLYYVQASTRSQDASPSTNTVNQMLYVSINDDGMLDLNSIHFYTHNSVNNGYFPSGVKGKGAISGVYFLSAGQTIRIKGVTANSSAAGTALKTDGSCQLMIVKL